MQDVLAKAEVVAAVFSDVLGASPRGVADRKGVFVVEEEGLDRAAFSAEIIALSRLWV
jgi:hypothetical protein